MALDPNHDAKQAFDALFTRVTVGRSNRTFDGVPPNHDGVVVTVNRYSTPKPSKSAPPRKGPSASAARKALRASIPVTYA
jgi:hypothetical protein